MDTKIKDQEIGFSSLAFKYDKIFGTGLMGRLTKEKIKGILPFINPRFGESILEVGPGSGLYTVELLKQGAKVTCLDISKEMLDETKKKVERLGYKSSYYQGNILDLPFEDNTFDKVVAIAVLPSIPDRKLVTKAVDEMLRVVKNGGTVYFDVPRYHPIRLLYTKFFLKIKPYTKETRRITTNLFTLKGIGRLVYPKTIAYKEIAWGIYYFIRMEKP